MRYLYSEADSPQAGDYYYEVRHITNDDFPLVPSHTHNCYEIYMFINGSVILQVEEYFFKANVGDIIIIPPYTIHQLIQTEPKTLPYVRMYMYISEPALKSFQFNEHSILKYLKQAQNKNRFHFSIKDKDEHKKIHDLLFSVYNRQKTESFERELMNRANILELMTILNKNIINDLNPQGIIPPTNPLIEKVISYINENYMDNISVDDLAKLFYVSRSTLSSDFKKQTAQTIHNYVNMKRLSVAKQEMSNGVTPSEVCSLCGFRDYSTFYRAFQKQENISPKEFFHKMS